VDAVLRTSWRHQKKTVLRKVSRLVEAPPFIAELGTEGRPFSPTASGSTVSASPAVSVILPTRNRATIVGEAIASVQAQTFRDWELLVVDDGSTDDTAEVLRSFRFDTRIRCLAQDFAGHAVARNRGLGEAHGELVAYLDSDNLWYPNFLAAAVAALACHHATDCVYGVLVSDAHPAQSRRGTSVLFQDFDRQRLLKSNFIDINTVVHRRLLVDVYGGFDETLDRLVDWDLLLRYTQHKPPRRVPVLAARYRIVDDQRVTATRSLERNLSAIRRKWPVG
jgi:glycosyltransferase involved in cell wall biosynthesis